MILNPTNLFYIRNIYTPVILTFSGISQPDERCPSKPPKHVGCVLALLINQSTPGPPLYGYNSLHSSGMAFHKILECAFVNNWFYALDSGMGCPISSHIVYAFARNGTF